MRYIGYIELTGMYLRELDLRDTAAVVHRGATLLDVSAGAAACGVSTGFSLAEAKAILRDRAVYVEYCEDDFLAARDVWLGYLLRYTDRIEPASPCSAFVDLSGHPEPLEIAGVMLGEIHDREQLPILCGIASAKWLAKLSAQPCDPVALSVGILPIEPVADPKGWLAPKGVDCLEPLSPGVLKALYRMGLQRIRDVQNLPDAALAQQFKKSAPLIRAVADGRYPDEVAGSWPPASFVSSLHLGGCESLLELDSALGQLAVECAYHLSSIDRVAGGVRLYVMFESHALAEQSRKLKRPTQSRSELLVCLRQMLLGVEMSEPIESLRVHLSDLTRSPRKQTKLEYSGERDRTMLDATLGRIQGAYGSGAVIKGTEIRHSREQRVLKAWKDAYGWK